MRHGKWISFWTGASTVFVLAMMLGATATWALFRRGFSARAEITPVEAVIARHVLYGAMPRRYRSLENPVAPSDWVMRDAMAHYADRCATCHSNNGNGDTMIGRGLNPRPPDLRLAQTQSRTDGELYSVIQNGVRLSGMPAFGSPGEDDRSTWSVVLFLRYLPRLSAEEEHAMGGLNPVTPSELLEQKDEDDFLTPVKRKVKGMQ